MDEAYARGAESSPPGSHPMRNGTAASARAATTSAQRNTRVIAAGPSSRRRRTPPPLIAPQLLRAERNPLGGYILVAEPAHTLLHEIERDRVATGGLRNADKRLQGLRLIRTNGRCEDRPSAVPDHDRARRARDVVTQVHLTRRPRHRPDVPDRDRYVDRGADPTGHLRARRRVERA